MWLDPLHVSRSVALARNGVAEPSRELATRTKREAELTVRLALAPSRWGPLEPVSLFPPERDIVAIEFPHQHTCWTPGAGHRGELLPQSRHIY